MVRAIYMVTIVLALSPGLATETSLGTAPQHEEWSRKFTATGSTTKATMLQQGEDPGEQQPGSCWSPELLFRGNPADQWQPEPCA
jgi:hypothetical protein